MTDQLTDRTIDDLLQQELDHALGIPPPLTADEVRRLIDGGYADWHKDMGPGAYYLTEAAWARIEELDLNGAKQDPAQADADADELARELAKCPCGADTKDTYGPHHADWCPVRRAISDLDTAELTDLPTNLPLYDLIEAVLDQCTDSSLDDEHDRAHVARRLYAAVNRLVEGQGA